MKIRYSESTNELEITSSKDNLLYLSKKLLEDGAQIKATVEENSKAVPYDRFLYGIDIKVLQGKLVDFQVNQNDTLLIKGDCNK